MITPIALIIFSALISFISLYFLIPRLKRRGIVGKDVNKKERPEVAEMGGFGIVAGFSAGVLLALLAQTFFNLHFNTIFVLAGLLTIHAIAFIGILDDLISIPQAVKAIIPMAASVPLVVLAAVGSTAITIPFIGQVDFGLVYVFVLIPLAITVVSNLTNMFAGFNGLEAGMGIVIFCVLSIVSFFSGKIEALILSSSMLGALLGFYPYNKYPAKVFPGDVGNLSIGAALASIVIIGNIESIGVILTIPYIVDFIIKAMNGFPTTKWWGEIRNGKLYPVEGKVRGLAQLAMKFFNGIEEKKLAWLFIFMEIVLGMLAISTFFRLM